MRITAPAPSPKITRVERSAGSVIPDIFSEAITKQHFEAPERMKLVPVCSAVTNPVQAELRSKPPALGISRARWTSAALISTSAGSLRPWSSPERPSPGCRR